MLIDSHCHLDFPDFAEERAAIVARAQAAGVGRMVTISTRVKRFQQIIEIAETFSDVYCSVGTHPHNAAEELDVTTDDQGGTAVSAGKYLNDRTYLSIQKGDKPGSGKARIDLDIGRGVKLRGEASDAGEAKGGIFYEKEY